MNEAENEKTVNYIRKTLGKESYGFKVDVSDRDKVYEAAKKSEILAGKITILVNNAGIVGGRDFLELDDRIIEKTMQVNSISHLWTTKAFLPSMLESDHGHIVSIASSAGYFAVPKLSDYCASKAAAAHFADVRFRPDKGATPIMLNICFRVWTWNCINRIARSVLILVF